MRLRGDAAGGDLQSAQVLAQPLDRRGPTDERERRARLRQPRERSFDLRHILERGIRADLSIIKGWRADASGNLQFRKTARNFNQPMATAADICVAEVEEVVPVGTLDPDAVHLPGIYVKRLIVGSPYDKKIEFRMTRQRPEQAAA